MLKGELFKPTLSIDLPIHADLRDFFKVFFSEVGRYHIPLTDPQYLEWCRSLVLKYDPVIEAHSPNHLINPYAFVDHLFSVLPTNATVVAGMALHVL